MHDEYRSFVETPRKFIIAKLPIHNLAFPALLYSTDEDPSLRMENFACSNKFTLCFHKNNPDNFDVILNRSLSLPYFFQHFLIQNFPKVGGPGFSKVIYQMNMNGRAAVCGAIATYNERKPGLGK